MFDLSEVPADIAEMVTSINLSTIDDGTTMLTVRLYNGVYLAAEVVDDESDMISINKLLTTLLLRIGELEMYHASASAFKAIYGEPDYPSRVLH